MWESYEPPREKPERAADGSVPVPPPRQGREWVDQEFAPAVRAGGQHKGAGAAIGIVAVLATIGISIGIASSVEDQPSDSDHSDFYACVDEQAEDPGLLSPAEICEIGHERPPGYVDDDEYDPFEDSGYGQYGQYGY